MSNGQATTASPPPRTAAEIGREVALGRKARSLLAPDLRPGQYLARLIERRLHADAIRYMAHSLLNREAVWWACLCVRHAMEAGNPAPAHRGALGAAVRWVLDPNEANRREAGAAASAAGRRVPAGCVAKAAQYAAGPPAPPGPPPRPPGASPGPPGAPPPALILPALSAKLCAGGILLAAARGNPADISVKLRQSIALGLDVAYGTNRWE